MKYGTRLADPENLVSPKELAELSEKISICITQMFRTAEKGGDPFLFTLCAPKPHYLAADATLADKIFKDTGRQVKSFLTYATAATDGRAFYWHPEFLKGLAVAGLSIVMKHESFHVVFDHPRRLQHCVAKVRAIAVDYVVNACVEMGDRLALKEAKAKRGEQYVEKNFDFGDVGFPISFSNLLGYIDGIQDDYGSVPLNKVGIPRIYSDIALYMKTPEWIYEQIMLHWEKSPRLCKTCHSLSMDPKTGLPKEEPCKNRPLCKHGGLCCPDCGSALEEGDSGWGGVPIPMDSHIDSVMSKTEVQADVLRAVSMTKAINGRIPHEIEDFIKELDKPTLKFTDLIRSACLRKVNEEGLKNNWRRPRRRYLGMDMYVPKKNAHTARWLCLLDTSGSMRMKEDIEFGVAQLGALGNSSHGLVVPVDAIPHWDKATNIRSASDLKQTQIVGRGGTVFDEFFTDYKKKVGTDWDCIVVITDGGFGHIPINLKPSCDVVWVVTQGDYMTFKPPFGRVAPLRIEKM